MQTAKSMDILAFYQHNGDTYRIIDKVEDFKVERVDGTGGRWFSTHSGLTLAADIQMALSSYFGIKILQKDIDFTID